MAKTDSRMPLVLKIVISVAIASVLLVGAMMFLTPLATFFIVKSDVTPTAEMTRPSPVPATVPAVVCEMPQILTPIQGNGFAMITPRLVLADPNTRSAFLENKEAIVSTITDILKTASPTQLEGTQGRDFLKKAIITGVNGMLVKKGGSAVITDAYFSEFLIQ